VCVPKIPEEEWDKLAMASSDMALKDAREMVAHMDTLQQRTHTHTHTNTSSAKHKAPSSVEKGLSHTGTHTDTYTDNKHINLHTHTLTHTRTRMMSLKEWYHNTRITELRIMFVFGVLIVCVMVFGDGFLQQAILF